MYSPQITPLIIAFENHVIVRYTLNSLLKWGFPPSSITVFDNGSSPEAKSLILSYSKELGCHTVDSPVNHGWGAAINNFLECHDIFPMESILLVMAHDAFFISFDSTEILQFFYDPSAIFVVPSYPEPLTSHYNIFKSYFTRAGFVEGLIQIGHQTAFFARRSLLKAIRYDEEYWLYGDEYDIFYRASRAGYRSFQAVSTIVVNPSSDSSSEFSMLAYKLNSLYTAFHRHGRIGLIVRSLVIFLSILRLWSSGEKRMAEYLYNLLRFSLANPRMGLRSYRSNPRFYEDYPIPPLIPV